MKKKLLAIGLAVAVLAVTIVGMSIAYFTATDEETNTFTVPSMIATSLWEMISGSKVLMVSTTARPLSSRTNPLPFLSRAVP